MLQEARDFIKSREKVNLAIVSLNILIFVIFNLIGNTNDSQFMAEHGAMIEPYITYRHEYYRLFTCMFLHFSTEHLISNMLLLIFAGDMLEKIVGKVRYLIIYLGGGLVGNLLSWYIEHNSKKLVVSAGASGAIFAVMGALVLLALLNRKRLSRSYVQRLVLMTVLSLADGYSQTSINNAAHLGGFLGGLVITGILILYLRWKRRA